jgi:hypothetical protein
MINLTNFEGDSPFEVIFDLKKVKNSIILNYLIKGDISQLAIEEKGCLPNRIIGLWKKFCLEFYIKNKKDDNYLEFNFSSNHNWNIFTFTSIRSTLTELATNITPELSSTITDNEFRLEVVLANDIFNKSFPELKDMIYSPTTILNTKSGKKFHFASTHPDNKLDFHRYKSFDQSL